MVVDRANCKCDGCFFYKRDCSSIRDVRGFCSEECRTDKKCVIFVEVNDEQPQEQAEQPQELNLCEILKDCPEGTELWSDDYGKVEFLCIDTSLKHPIKVIRTDGYCSNYTKEGWCNINFPANCLLWSSRDCRDWSKFTAPWLKKEKFDPKTLKAFDKILIYSCGRWEGSFFNRLLIQSTGKIGRVLTSCGSSETYCVPYNDDTKHLLGTKDEAPEFYRYWED